MAKRVTVYYGLADMARGFYKNHPNDFQNYEEEVLMQLYIDDIIEKTREEFEIGECYELYWDDFTKEFQIKYLERFRNDIIEDRGGNYITVDINHDIMDGKKPLYEWVKVEFDSVLGKEKEMNNNVNDLDFGYEEEEIDLQLYYDDIIEDTREKMIEGEEYELHWDDFTEEFQDKYFNLYHENGNYDVIPLIVCLDQHMIAGITPVFEWAHVED